MKLLSVGIIICMSLILSACASYPKNPPEQATHHIKKAQDAIARGERDRAVEEISIALIIETGNEKIKTLFANEPIIREFYINYLEKSATDITTVYQAGIAYKNLTNVKNSGVLPESVVEGLFAVLSETVVSGNSSGSIPFDFGDKVEDFPELQSASHQKIIVSRSIKNLQDKNWRIQM